VYSFEKLEIWQLSLDLVEKIYDVTERLPEDEKFGLISQLKRASVSVSLNIAEGRGSDSDLEFRRFLGIALKSLIEIIACMKICERLRFLDNITVSNICGFCDKIEAKIRKFRSTLSKGRNALATKSVKRKASSVKR
jgi:four helix bundle protein